MFRTYALAAAAALSLGLPAWAADTITVEEAYALASGPTAIAGGAFMVIRNSGTEDDRLVTVSGDVAQRIELHTNLIDANGVARMIEVEDGFAIPAGESHALERGGDHVMLMGLTAPLEEGATFPLILTFEKAGEIVVDVVVDLGRKPAMPMHGHGTGG